MGAVYKKTILEYIGGLNREKAVSQALREIAERIDRSEKSEKH